MRALACLGVLSLAACGGPSTSGETKGQNDKPAERPLLDATVAATCTVTYSCGLSHPGLGTSLNAVTVDLATCMRTKRNESGPYEGDGPTAPPADAPPPPVPEAVPADQCRRVLELVTAITPTDVRDGQESAHVDSTACDLNVVCQGASRIRVQRQTTSGVSRVEQLIRAL